ncbi:MAG: tetratricopeptide repeat protein, partial [Candidatus Competibacteraceae bacterium]|nr:tetratricopeptide repeat protein [Candidatus Competibacteraceae bacterium]
MFFRIMAFLRHALILALVTLLLGSCATIVTEEVLSPPKLLKQAITSIQVKRFAGEYGRQLSVQIEGNLQTVSLIKIRTHGAQAVLTGSIQVARVTSDSYSKSFKVKKKDSNGKKYKTTKTYYYLQKRGLASLTYSLVSGSKVLASNAHNAMFERVSSGASSQEAKASAISNNEIISDLIGQLAEKVIQDISPHKTHFSFQLQKGGHDYLNIGIAYYKKELYSQAEEYWNRVLNAVYSNPQDRAAAAYNLGVLYVHNGALPQAFQMFRQADGLHPLNTVYMDALKLRSEEYTS